MGSNAELYEHDFYAWTQTTAALIRKELWYALDPDALAEEVESLGRSEKRELESRLEVLVLHLLKWRFQPTRREDSHSWDDTIVEQRSQLAKLLRDNPSLRPTLPTIVHESYPTVRRRVQRQTRLPLGTFPDTCPWTLAQLLDEDFWPEEPTP